MIDSSFVDGYSMPLRLEYKTGGAAQWQKPHPPAAPRPPCVALVWVTARCQQPGPRGGLGSPPRLAPAPVLVMASSPFARAGGGGLTTLLGTMSEAACAAAGGKQLHDASGGFAGCQSPCSATDDPKACCAGAYDTPETCHPGGTPASAAVPGWCDAISKMFAKDGKRVGYCYAYDDDAGSITDHERGLTDQSAPRIKVTFCDYA